MTPNNNANGNGGTEPVDDPSAVILPHVDTAQDVLGELNLEELVVFLPAFALAGVSAFMLLAGNGLIAGILAVPAMIALFGAMYASITSKWYSPPRERVYDFMRYLKARQSLPNGHDETVGAVHGVKTIHEDGRVECRDGRHVLPIPVYGTNADQIDSQRTNQLVAGLTQAKNVDLRDMWFSLYSTTRDASTADLSTIWEDRVLDDDPTTDTTQKTADPDQQSSADAASGSELTSFQKRVLLNGVDWLRAQDQNWNANDWRDFIEIKVAPYEYKASEADLEAETAPEGRFETIISDISDLIEPLKTKGFDMPDDETGGIRTASDVMADRIHQIENAVATIDGVELGDPSPATSADLLAEHWTDGGHVTGDDLERLVGVGRREIGEYTRAERFLAPQHYDNMGTTMQIGEKFARTYWIENWPMNPGPLFLRNLHTLSNVDLSVRIIVEPEDKQDVVDELEIEIARSRGEEQRRTEEGEVSSLAIVDDIDAYERAYHALQQTDAQSSQISAYVTVRADNLTDLKMDCKEVKRTLESYPASCTPVAHGTRQKEAFASSAPCAPNVFDRETWTDKGQRALSGAVGAMFPFIRTSIHEPRGIRWGRNTQDGTSLQADPFNRGGGPHLITLGETRGGKTYSVSQAVAEWFMADPDRTLIVCDTQKGFDGLTEMLDGEHIIIDSSNGVNPFYIEPPKNEKTTAETAFSMKIDEASEFVAGTLRAQDIDPSEYRPTIELAVQETYIRNGIKPDHIPDDPECPTVRDFVETLRRMIKSSEEYTLTGEEVEADVRKQRVSELLERLTGFMESGKYSHIVDETDAGITPETRMAYLDLRHLDNKGEAEKSVHLHLMLSQISQLVKQTPGETIFVIDEAHLLLHSDEMLEYLARSTREWARYSAAMWFVTQSPEEFVKQSSGSSASEENPRQVILGQCSTLQIFHGGKGINSDTLSELGLTRSQIEMVQEGLTPGNAGKGYSECLLRFDDESGWFKTRVEAPPLLHAVLSYKLHRHGDFISYLRERTGEQVAALAAASRKDPASGSAEALDSGQMEETPDDVEPITPTEPTMQTNGHSQPQTTDGGENKNGSLDHSSNGEPDESEETDESKNGLTILSGMDETTAESFRTAGYHTVNDIHTASVDDLADVSGIDMQHAQRVSVQAAKLLATSGSEEEGNKHEQ